MKKRNSFILLMIVAVVTAMLFTACGNSKPTLQSFLEDNPDVKQQVDDQIASSNEAGIVVEFSGNDIVYTYDLAGMDGMTEELAKGDDIKAALESGLDAQTDTFKNVAKSLYDTVKEAGTELETVRVIVNYNYGDEVIVTRTFEADKE